MYMHVLNYAIYFCIRDIYITIDRGKNRWCEVRGCSVTGYERCRAF